MGVSSALARLGILPQVAVGTGVGNAVGGAIAPVVRSLENETWALHQDMPLLAIQAAQTVASGERSMAWGIEEATNTGVNEERFRALVDMFDTAPDLPTLYDLFHRGQISEAEWRRGVRKLNIEAEWLDGLFALNQKVLSPSEAANAWQQGFMSEPESEAEAERSGVNAQRSQIQRELAGLPPGAMDALVMLRRGLIDEATYRQIVREGHTKVKYTDALLGLRDRILTQTDAANLWLKGWISEAEAKRIGELNGYDAEAMDLLYQNRGRPATVRQAHIGYARGGRLPGAANEEETLRRAVEESNIRTEWFDILYAQRFTYPSAFVLRALAQDGTFTEAETRQILVESGWKPEWADAAASKWSQATGAGPGTKWADRARSRVFTDAWNDYLDGNADEAELRAALQAVGATGAEQDTIVNLANVDRQRTRRDLTQAQILKLYRRAIWPLDKSIAALEDQGMTPEDAADLLKTVSPT